MPFDINDEPERGGNDGPNPHQVGQKIAESVLRSFEDLEKAIPMCLACFYSVIADRTLKYYLFYHLQTADYTKEDFLDHCAEIYDRTKEAIENGQETERPN